MWKATLETSHFDFEAYGRTESGARTVLLNGLRAHGRQYGCAKAWYREYIADVQTQEIVSGVCYRDRDLIERGTAA